MPICHHYLVGGGIDAEQRSEWFSNDIALINIPLVQFIWTSHVNYISMFPENMSPPFGDGRFFMTGYGNIKLDPARPMVRTLRDLGEAAESK